MKFLTAAFVLALALAASARLAVELWDGRRGPSETNLRTIHYDSNYELTARRRSNQQGLPGQ